MPGIHYTDTFCSETGVFETVADTLQTLCFANARFRNILFQTVSDTLQTLCFANGVEAYSFHLVLDR